MINYSKSKMGFLENTQRTQRRIDYLRNQMNVIDKGIVKLEKLVVRSQILKSIT